MSFIIVGKNLYMRLSKLNYINFYIKTYIKLCRVLPAIRIVSGFCYSHIMLSKNDRYRHETFQDVFRETFTHATKGGLFGLGCALLL